LGHYHCPNGDSKRPIPAVSAADVELRGVRSAAFTLRGPNGSARVELPLPGLYNVYNALAAAALCTALGVTTDDIAGGLAGVAPARIAVVDELSDAVDAAREDGSGPLYALPTYTAMLELRQVLHGRALA